MDHLKHHNRCVCQNAFHFVWKPKYAYAIFAREDMRAACDETLRNIAEKHHCEVHELKVMPNHIHLFADLPPDMDPLRALQYFKGGSSYQLFRQFPELRKTYWGGHLWSPGKFFRSVGNVTAQTIEHYIAQSQGEWKFADRDLPDYHDLRQNQAKVTDFLS